MRRDGVHHRKVYGESAAATVGMLKNLPAAILDEMKYAESNRSISIRVVLTQERRLPLWSAKISSFVQERAQSFHRYGAEASTRLKRVTSYVEMVVWLPISTT